MNDDDIVARLRRKLLAEENAYDILRLENERLRAERDETRRAWCLYLAANTGLQKGAIASMNGWDCFDQTPNDIEAHEIRGDLAGGTQ